jgi:hypothetical protein
VDFTIRSLTGTFEDKNGNFTIDRPQEGPTNHHLAAAVSLEVAPKEQEAKPETEEAEDKPEEEAKAEPNEFRAFVLADADAVSDLIAANRQENQLLAFDVVRWLGGEESWAGGANVEEDVRIEHSEQKDRAWFYLTIIGMPLFVLIGGLFISARARRPKGGKK